MINNHNLINLRENSNSIIEEKKYLSIEWPTFLYNSSNYVYIENNFFFERKICISERNQMDFKLIPDGYKYYYSIFEDLKEELTNSTINYLKEKSFLQAQESFEKINYCFNEIYYDILYFVENYQKLEAFDFNDNLEEITIKTEYWNNVGLFSGCWENLRTFKNKKSIVIDGDFFLVPVPSEDLNSFLFHPFLDSNSISNFQNNFLSEYDNFIDSKN